MHAIHTSPHYQDWNGFLKTIRFEVPIQDRVSKSTLTLYSFATLETNSIDMLQDVLFFKSPSIKALM